MPFTVLLFVELAVAERDSKSASVSFSLFFCVGPSQKGSQAFLAETVETGDKTRQNVVMTRGNLILIVPRDILICSVILVCVREDWLVLGLS